MEVLIGTADGLRWGTSPAVQLGGHDIRALATDPQWWAAAEGTMILRSDGGGSWTEAASVEQPRPTCLLPFEDGVLVGTSEARLLRLSPAGLETVEGFNRVAGRDSWYTPWGGPPDTRSLSVGDDGAIYVNVHVGGIPRSSDGGATWKPTIDVDADVHQVLAASGEVLAATARGLARSADGERRWAFETDGLHAGYCRAVAVAGDVVLLSASMGPRGGHAAVYRKPLASTGPFEKCRGGLPEWFDANIDSHCLVAGGGFAAFGTADGRTFVSRDAGATWDQDGSGLPAIRCLALV